MEQASYRAMPLEMRTMDHQLTGLASQRRENPVAPTYAALADERAANHLGQAECHRRITPSPTIADHEDDAADAPDHSPLRH